MTQRVFVAVDIEGVAAVVSVEEGTPGDAEYERARRLMTGEANAVVGGIYDADRDAQVVVADVHGSGRNILPEELDERARLIRGRPRAMGMVHGIDQGFDLAMFVGVHGRAGAHLSALSHTFTELILDVLVNGKSLGELGLNAAVAGHFGVPVALVAGDQTAGQEARELLGPGVVTVEVKTSAGHKVVESVHPNAARAMLRAAAARVIREHLGARPLSVAVPVQVTVTLSRPVYADVAELIENVVRVDGRSIRFARPDMPSAYRVLRLVSLLCNLAI